MIAEMMVCCAVMVSYIAWRQHQQLRLRRFRNALNQFVQAAYRASEACRKLAEAMANLAR